MDLFARYKEEREGSIVYKQEYGFLVYSIIGKDCVLHEIYVHPDFRRKKIGKHMTDVVLTGAKELGCNIAYCSVSLNPRIKGASEAAQAFLWYGFKLSNAGPDGLLWFKKEI